MEWCEANGVDCVSGRTSFNGIDDGINGRSVLSLGLTPLNLLVSAWTWATDLAGRGARGS